MLLAEVIPLTKIPAPLPQILSYFTDQKINLGSLVLIPLGRRQEKAVVVAAHEINDFKMEIKKAGYEMRPLKKILSEQPVLTPHQLELARWLGRYYLASPGIFLKMMMPHKWQMTDGRWQGADAKTQKLIFVPTIAQTEKFSDAIAWHSGLTKKQQNEIWWKVKHNEAQTIIGTRSAVFLPFFGLKEIEIKDGTNPGHKSWDMFPHYRVHEAAQKLAELFGANLKFENKIPSVENNFGTPSPPLKKMDKGLTREFDMRNLAAIVDVRQEFKNGNFSVLSRALQNAIRDSLARNKQIILFINRRGAANFILCRDCGYIAKCSNCDSPLAYHSINGRPSLFCHRCGHQEAPPGLCPKCQSHKIKTVGVGTQKVEIEARKYFPKAEIARLDSDSAPEPKKQSVIIKNFNDKKTDILIATQIIFSWIDEIKNQGIATVAIISADTLMHLPDFRSGEKTFQIINQLKKLLAPSFSSENGHEFNSAKNNFIIQTHNPENQTLKYAASGDWNSFYEEEMEVRRALNYPPFSQIVKLTFRHKDPKKAGLEAKILAKKLQNILINFSASRPIYNSKKDTSPSPLQGRGLPAGRQGWGEVNPDIQISPALPAFIPKEKGKYIWNIIIKFKILNLEFKINDEFLIQRNSLLQYVPSDWLIDVDPEDLL